MHGSGYIARRPVRTTGAPVPLLQRSLASKSPPQGVTIPNAKSLGLSLQKNVFGNAVKKFLCQEIKAIHQP
jgi:hypothetical protein